MNRTGICPRCQRELTVAHGAAAEAPQPGDSGSAGGSALTCDACRGVFVPPSQIREDMLRDAVPCAPASPPGGGAGAGGLVCPGCGQVMAVLRLGDIALDRCESCRGVWLDGGEALDIAQPASALATLNRYLLYSLSLPERAVRSTIGLTAGAALESARWLVPQAFQSSKTYELVVQNSLKFLTENIGGVAAQEGGEENVENYLARKAVGNFVDLAGMATLHISPLWLLAIVSDVAYGSKTYVLELAGELQRQGVIDDTSTIHHAEDLLDAVQRASGRAAGIFDTPPLSVAELTTSLKETRDALASADVRSVLPEAELTQYWNEMREVAGQENVSLLGVSGAMTLHTLGKLKTVSQGALTSLHVAGGLLHRHVLGHYVDALQTIHERGFYQTVREASTPYIESVWHNFAGHRPTWTEDVLTGRVFSKAYSAVSGWLSGSKDRDAGGSN